MTGGACKRSGSMFVMGLPSNRIPGATAVSLVYWQQRFPASPSTLQTQAKNATRTSSHGCSTLTDAAVFLRDFTPHQARAALGTGREPKLSRAEQARASRCRTQRTPCRAAPRHAEPKPKPNRNRNRLSAWLGSVCNGRFAAGFFTESAVYVLPHVLKFSF